MFNQLSISAPYIMSMTERSNLMFIAPHSYGISAIYCVPFFLILFQPIIVRHYNLVPLSSLLGINITRDYRLSSALADS